MDGRGQEPLSLQYAGPDVISNLLWWRVMNVLCSEHFSKE